MPCACFQLGTILRDDEFELYMFPRPNREYEMLPNVIIRFKAISRQILFDQLPREALLVQIN
jgi:hypothetical protein